MGSGDLPRMAGASSGSPEVMPLWFGSGDQFGLLHLPSSGQARGGVVLCPTLGSERLWLHSANAELAVALAAEGFVVLRFDYRGTGHSGGDLQNEWPKGVLQEGVAAATSFVRATGVPTVALVGCRLGATIAASAVTTASCPDAMIPWVARNPGTPE
jgi:alpha/beta superfamily hydrolase